MGLALNLGGSELREHFDDDLALINEILQENGLPPHREPDLPPRVRMRAAVTTVSYSNLHYLRRLQAHVLQQGAEDPSWRPTPCSDEEPWKDPAVDEELCVYLRSHLILHADSEGYYVPVDFNDVLYGAPGGDMLGSSQRLLAEMRQLAPYLDIRLDAGGNLPDAEAQRLNRHDERDPFWREKMMWLLVFEAARLSVEFGTVVVFD
jgi:hypothetical protein